MLNEGLGWTGLGCCDGGSIGSGTMEACCYVVDFERDVLTKELAETSMVITQEFTMKTPDNSFKPKPLRDSDGFLALGR